MALMIVHTGEEGEETVYQCRAKLYVMQSDGGWKERGVGALKLNVKSADGKSPRLGTLTLFLISFHLLLLSFYAIMHLESALHSGRSYCYRSSKANKQSCEPKEF